jgi:hypothetical protein
MKTVPLVDHSVPLPRKGMFVVHVCQRESSSGIVVRKFKAGCGNTIEVHVTQKSGFIRSIKPVDDCQPNCLFCRERIQAIKSLIAREHQTS